MTNISKTLVFFGNERLSSGFSLEGAPTLEALISNGYSIAAVVANFEPATSRKARRLEVAEVAKKHNIPVLLPKKLTDIKDELEQLEAEAGVLVAYGKIIPQQIIDLFPKGIINIHPSLLPLYRGSTPIEQAILDGASETGVSIMQIVKEMDAGPLYNQQRINLTGKETKQELTNTLLQLGSKMLIETLPRILDGTVKVTPQNEESATYTPQIKKQDGAIDWSKPALRIEREIRAYAGWPKSTTTLFGKHVIITKASATDSNSTKGLAIPCSDGAIEITEIIGPSGKRMTGQAFLNGYADKI